MTANHTSRPLAEDSTHAKRDDIIDIIKIAREEGYENIQLNTNSIRSAFDPDFPKKIRGAGSNVIYTSFDGPTP